MSHFTFNEPCSSCGAVPSYNGHGLCEVCVTGDESERNSWAKVLKDGGYLELSNKPLYIDTPASSKQQIKDLMLELIGEDRKAKQGTPHTNQWNQAQNELRSVLRQKVEDL